MADRVKRELYLAYLQEGFDVPAHNSTDAELLNTFYAISAAWDDPADCFRSWSNILLTVAKVIESGNMKENPLE